ncbi:MAG: DUF4333 domain-containing protein [Deltaproteobacteria bacterium]|nr:DUF4333 domain-containing protein [Deltaproteobacteria bacterium]
MLRTALVAVVLATVALTGCKKQIDAAKGEKLLSEPIDKAGFKVKVTCPKDIEIKEGGTFDCEATGEDGTFKINVTMKDDEGNVTSRWEPGVLDTKDAIEQAKAKVPDVKITCPKRIIVLKNKGDTSTCEAATATEKGQLTITMDDPEKGAWSWKLAEK